MASSYLPSGAHPRWRSQEGGDEAVPHTVWRPAGCLQPLRSTHALSLHAIQGCSETTHTLYVACP